MLTDVGVVYPFHAEMASGLQLDGAGHGFLPVHEAVDHADKFVNLV